jgi:hypothetical protein
MSQTSAKIVLDSINPTGQRLTTLQIRLPKWLLAEVNTHRVTSKNYNSARAIPSKAFRQLSTYTPPQFLSNKPGMQGGEELVGFDLALAKFGWEFGRASAKITHQILSRSNLHKQYTNRVLEPFSYCDGIISSTTWDNFFAQRCHKDAQPDFQDLACQIREQLNQSTPQKLNREEWHTPFIDPLNHQEQLEMRKKHYNPLLISAARVARVSYGYLAGEDGQNIFDLDKDFKRGSMLLDAEVKHLSPFEMVSMAVGKDMGTGNFQGWHQLRKEIEVSEDSDIQILKHGWY